VISDANVHAPLELYHFLKETGAALITFLPLVEKDTSGNQAVSPRSVRPFDFGRFLSAVFDEWIEKDIGIVKVQIFEEALRDAFSQEHTLCIFRKVCGGVPPVTRASFFMNSLRFTMPVRYSSYSSFTFLVMI
jgi:uncharacterized protein